MSRNLEPVNPLQNAKMVSKLLSRIGCQLVHKKPYNYVFVTFNKKQRRQALEILKLHCKSTDKNSGYSTDKVLITVTFNK